MSTTRQINDLIKSPQECFETDTQHGTNCGSVSCEVIIHAMIDISTRQGVWTESKNLNKNRACKLLPGLNS